MATHLDSTDATIGQSHLTSRARLCGYRTSCRPRRKARAIVRARNCAHGPISLAEGSRIFSGWQLIRMRRFDGNAITPLEGKLEIPPGTAKVEQRMRFNGSFYLPDAQFTSAKIQDRVDELSLCTTGSQRRKTGRAWPMPSLKCRALSRSPAASSASPC